MKRRNFLLQATQASAFMASYATVSNANSAVSVIGANDRVHIGLIGCGGRGQFDARNMRQVPNVEIAAVCDVYGKHRDAAQRVFNPRLGAFKDFRKLLEQNELDAVIVATPDHWHAIPTILACQSGKDVYVEKPLAYTIQEGQLLLKAAQKYNRIVQTGTQQRSAQHFQEIHDLIQSGTIGQVHFVRIWNYRNMYPEGIGKATVKECPSDLDWDFFLGPAPYVDFDWNRFDNFRWFRDYSGGVITDYGNHRFDTLHQIMETDSPRSVSATGGRYALSDGGDIPDILQVTYEYPNFVLSYESCVLNAHGLGGDSTKQDYYRASGKYDRPNGLAFYGTEGTIVADRIGYEIYPEPKRQFSQTAVTKSPLEYKFVASRDASAIHAQNFIDCVRSRKPPAADIAIGHRSTIIPHLGNIAYETGRKIVWDATQEKILNDPEASKLLQRQNRKPWDKLT